MNVPRIPILASEERRKVVKNKFYNIPINKLCREELFIAIYNLKEQLEHTKENLRKSFKTIEILEKELAKYRLKEKNS